MKRTNFSNQVGRSTSQYELNSSVLEKFMDACLTRNNICVRLGCICLIISSSLMTVSCRSSENGKDEDSGIKQAITMYKEFLNEVNGYKDKDISNLITLCKRWYALRDTVSTALPHDTLIVHGCAERDEFMNINDSIVSKITEIIRSNEYTLTDYLNIRFALGYIPNEERYRPHIKTGYEFFSSLDYVNPYQGDCKTAIDRYASFLKNTLKKGISSQKELESFIAVEDRNFRTSLRFLHDLGENSLAPINEMTGEVIGRISFELIDSCKPFEKEKVLVMMVMRSNRRLIANAWQCAKDIQDGKLRKDAELYTAYFWMLLNPFIYIDDIAVCLMPEELKAQYYRLAATMPELMAPIIKELPVEAFNLKLLPTELIIAYLTKIR